MNSFSWVVCLFLTGVLIASLSQVLLKKSAVMRHPNAVKQYVNPYVITAYALFFLSMLISMFSYKWMPLSLGLALEATGYLYIPLLGRLVLKEKISARQIVGNVLIVVGILVFAYC